MATRRVDSRSETGEEKRTATPICKPSPERGRWIGAAETDEVSLLRKRSAISIRRYVAGKRRCICCAQDRNCRSFYWNCPNSDTSSGTFGASFPSQGKPSSFASSAFEGRRTQRARDSGAKVKIESGVYCKASSERSLHPERNTFCKASSERGLHPERVRRTLFRREGGSAQPRRMRCLCFENGVQFQ